MLKLLAEILVMGFMMVLFAVTLKLSPTDDSDPPGGRSGMVIYTDALTGCQYLGTALAGITPRVGANGKQICKENP